MANVSRQNRPVYPGRAVLAAHYADLVVRHPTHHVPMPPPVVSYTAPAEDHFSIIISPVTTASPSLKSYFGREKQEREGSRNELLGRGVV